MNFEFILDAVERKRLAGLLKCYRRKILPKLNGRGISQINVKNLLGYIIIIDRKIERFGGDDECEEKKKYREALSRYNNARIMYHRGIESARRIIPRVLEDYITELYDRASENSIPWGDGSRLNGQHYGGCLHATGWKTSDRGKYEPDLPTKKTYMRMIGGKSWRERRKLHTGNNKNKIGAGRREK